MDDWLEKIQDDLIEQQVQAELAIAYELGLAGARGELLATCEAPSYSRLQRIRCAIKELGG